MVDVDKLNELVTLIAKSLVDNPEKSGGSGSYRRADCCFRTQGRA